VENCYISLICQWILETCYYDTHIHTQLWHKGVFVILTLKNKGRVGNKWIIKCVCQFCVKKVCHNNISDEYSVLVKFTYFTL
jgi:hypothetical protein